MKEYIQLILFIIISILAAFMLKELNAKEIIFRNLFYQLVAPIKMEYQFTDIGQMLKVLRETNEIGIENIAYMLGISKRKYLLIEDNKKELTASQVIKICRLYGIESKQFLKV